MTTPLWLAAAVTAPAAEFAAAWQPRPRLLSGPRRRPARLAAAPLVLSPALASAAVTGSPPLRMRVVSGRFGLPRSGLRIRLRAFTATPQTLSSVDVRAALEPPQGRCVRPGCG